MNLNNHKGFTLIEVIFSITLLGILGTSIFLLQGSIMRYVMTTQNKVSSCITMHNTWIMYRIQGIYDKNTLPDFLKKSLDSAHIEKKALITTQDEKIKFGKLFKVVITEKREETLYAHEQVNSYMWYDSFLKENDERAT